MKRFEFILILLTIQLLTFANQPMVRNFTRDIYKSGTQNWAIVQDKSNRMFFANNNGLLEFDGENWTTYPINNGTNVRSVLYGRDGLYYASSFNEFGYYTRQNNGKLIYSSLNEKLGKKMTNSNGLYSIHQGKNNIYFQSERMVLEYNGDTVLSYPFLGKIDASAFVHNVLFVTSSQNGAYMLTGNIFVRIPGSEILQNKNICAILPFENNKVLFVSSFSGAFMYDGNTIVRYDTGIDEFLKSNQVFCATTNGNQIVYGTVQRGVAIQKISDKSVIYVNTFSGLQNNTVLSVAFDFNQNLWLGLDKGIDYILLNSPIQNIFGTNNLYGAGYTSILKNNTMYFGTNQGLYTSSFPLPNSPSPIQLKLINGMEGQVWNLDDIDNTLFCGTDRGAFIVSKDKIEKISELQGTWKFKQLRSHLNMILGCSYQGLFILKKENEKWKFSHFIKGKFAESSPMFEEAKDGNVWFSHWQKGLFRLHLNDKMDSIVKVDLYDTSKGLPSIRNNTMFRVGDELIFSSERGFYKYNDKMDKMEVNEKWNSLFNNPPSYIRLHEGKNGDVWCISGQFVGLAKKGKNNSYKIDSLTYHILQPKIVIGFEHFNFIDNNNVIVNTEDGFSWIDLNKKTITTKTFNVFLHKVVITSDKGSVITISENPTKAKQSNNFAHSQNSLRFEFIAPEYRNEGLVRYSYMLENYDNTWSEFNEINIKEYTQLPKGNYTFKVIAHDLLESRDATCSYSFTVLPAWYESQLAFIIYSLIVLILIIVLIFWINNQSKKGARDMEKQKEKELKEQKKNFDAETSEKKREIKELKNQKLQYELRHKSQELASSTMNLIRKNEMLQEIINNISKVSSDLKSESDTKKILSKLNTMERSIKQNIEHDDNWKRFEENFDLVYENYMKRLSETFPDLSVSDKKLCAYLKMDLTSKDIAQLMNMTIRSVETNRYRLRKKIGLERDVNLSEFLQRF